MWLLILLISLKTENIFTENTVTKYFLLLQITVHPFLALGWSINSATDQPKKRKETNVNTAVGNKCTSSVTLFKYLNDMTPNTLSNFNRETYFLCLGF